MQPHYVPPVSVNVNPQMPRQPQLRARKRPMDSLNFTFQKLKEKMSGRMQSGDGLCAASGPNVLSALNAFMAERGYSDKEPVGSILRASFQRNVASHVEALKKEKRTAAYIANRKSLLTNWRRTIIEADQVTAAQLGRESPFQAGLRELFANGASQKGTCRDCGLPLPTLKRWLAGKVPNRRSLRWVPCLEKHFGLPSGTLTDLLPYRLGAAKSNEIATRPIAYRERLKIQHLEPYALKIPNDRLRREWRDLVSYKVAKGNGRGSLQRAKNGRWSTTGEPVKPQRDSNWYAFYGNLYVASADIQWGMTAQFFGWLMMPVEKGGKAQSAEAAMTLANFARDDLIGEYQDWRLARSGGRGDSDVDAAHGGIIRFLTVVSSLCNAKTGYLTQNWETFSDTARAKTHAAWLEDCQFAFDFSKSSREDMEENAAPSRNSFDPIRQTLDLPNPLEAIADAIIRLDADRPSTGGEDEAIWARDRLLLKLLASNPLRDKNTRMLTYRADGTGNLRKVDGKWLISIAKADFKNARGAAKDRPYVMPVREEVWPDIERYLRDYRPMLASEPNPYVFASSRGGVQPMGQLRKRFAVLTRRYLTGCPGVGPHAMRHIVATSILKQRPNDWAAAAWALHDREDSVRKHYAYLTSNDAHQWFDASMSGPFARM